MKVFLIQELKKKKIGPSQFHLSIAPRRCSQSHLVGATGCLTAPRRCNRLHLRGAVKVRLDFEVRLGNEVNWVEWNGLTNKEQYV